MKLTRLSIDNFMSVKHCETYLNDRGLVLIQGDNQDDDSFESNGAGKSTIFSDAPAWCIYGSTVRGKKGDTVINRHEGKNTRVSLDIEDDNGDVYTVVRHRKHKEHKNHVLLFKNEENITAKSDKDTDAKIVDLLELDYLSFTNSILFGQGMTSMFASSTDGEQKAILERMLRIDVFRACQDKAKERLTKATKDHNDLIKDIESNEKDKVSTKQIIDDLQDKEANLSKQINAQIAEMGQEMVSLQGELESLGDTNGLEEDRSELQSLVSKIRERIDEYKEQEDNRDELIGDERALKREIKTLQDSISGSKQKLHDIQSGKNIPKVCNACGQDLPLDDTTAIENHLQDDIAKREKEVDGKLTELTDVQKLLKKVYGILEGKKVHEQTKQELLVELANIHADIKNHKDKQSQLSRSIARLEKSIKDQEKLLETTYTDLIEENIRKLEALNVESGRLDSLLEQSNAHIDKLNFWVNSFGNSGIKSVLLDSVTPYLNTRANYYLNKLSGQSIEVEFTTQTELKSGDKRDKFSVGVKNQYGDNEYAGNSNGEKRRIDIAINMALQDLVSNRSSKRIDLIVYDEIYDGLDAVGCESAIELLNEKANVFGSVFVITHNDSLKQLFTKSIVVSKVNGETTITEEG